MRDRAWVRKLLSGDRVAGELLVTEGYPRIYRMLRNLTGSPETAEDLTQQTFARAWQALETYRGEARLITWLHSIAYHEYTHWLRARRDCSSLADAAEVPDAHPADGLTTVMVRSALARLTAEHRETFVLFYIQDLSISEAASVLGIPPGTVKSRLSAARQKMRALLQEDDSAPEPAGAVALRSYHKEVAGDAVPASQIVTK